MNSIQGDLWACPNEKCGRVIAGPLFRDCSYCGTPLLEFARHVAGEEKRELEVKPKSLELTEYHDD